VNHQETRPGRPSAPGRPDKPGPQWEPHPDAVAILLHALGYPGLSFRGPRDGWGRVHRIDPHHRERREPELPDGAPWDPDRCGHGVDLTLVACPHCDDEPAEAEA